jgi:hypothetical protein
MLWCFSILLRSICNFPNIYEALTSRGLGVAGLYVYSSVFFGSTQKDRMGCLGFVMIRIVVFTLLNIRFSARVGRMASHIIFSVRQIICERKGGATSSRDTSRSCSTDNSLPGEDLVVKLWIISIFNCTGLTCEKPIVSS